MLHLHSFLRYVVLIFLITTIVKSLIGWINKKDFTAGDAKLALFQMIFVQVQFLLGIYLYFARGWWNAPMDMANEVSRFWKVEHITGMILAVALVEIGRIRTKKSQDLLKKHKTSFIFYTLAFIFIVMMIPWERVGWI